MSDEPSSPTSFDFNRRTFIATAAGTVLAAPLTAKGAGPATIAPTPQDPSLPVDVVLNVNGQRKSLTLDARTTVLDALREHLDLTGSKKGCDHGQCGACTVLIGGQRVLSSPTTCSR